MSKGLVLLVDDYPGQRQASTAVLERHGFEVEAFSNASDLLQRFQLMVSAGTPPVAIVSDNDIKGSISGTQLAREIRLLDRNIPFLLVSNLDVKSEITNSLCISFLKKDNLFDGTRPKGERNLIGMKLDEMIQNAASLGSGQLQA